MPTAPALHQPVTLTPPVEDERPDPRGFVVEIRDHGTACPRLRCELCGEWITEAGLAGVVWGKPRHDAEAGADTYADGRVHTPRILCKTNGCLSRPPWRRYPWEELADFLRDLAHNVGLRPRAKRRRYRG